MGRPEPLRLQAGPVTAVLRDGQLRDVRVDGALVLDAVYVAVRDPRWGTVPGVLEALEESGPPGGFRVAFRSRHDVDGVPFTWQALVEGRDGAVVLRMDGVPEADLAANRIGFCLLHPLELAGRPVRVRTPAGSVDGVFPERISPHQPFREVVGLTYRVDDEGPGVDVDLEGDLFEVEDHRNWTDPGYKTYCTPLVVPSTRVFPAGEHVRQQVTLRALPAPAQAPVQARVHDGARRWQAPPTGGPARLRIDRTGPGAPPLPALGVTVPPVPADLASLRPHHLLVDVHLGAEADPAATLRAARERARAAGAVLDVAVVADGVPGGPALADLARALTDVADRLARVFVFDAATATTVPGSAAAVRSALRARGIDRRVGGGSRLYFAELNRARLPLDELDLVTYGISPEVHHADDESVVATLRAQPATLRGAVELAGGRPVVVAPVVLPTAAAEVAAAWTVGTLVALAGCDSLTLDDPAGAASGVLAALAPYLALPRLAVSGLPAVAAGEGPRDLTSLALGTPESGAVVVADLSGSPRTVEVQPEGAVEVVELEPYQLAVVLWDGSRTTACGIPKTGRLLAHDRGAGT